MNARDITVERHLIDGFTLSAIWRGQLIHERYVGYSLREAKGTFIAKYR